MSRPARPRARRRARAKNTAIIPAVLRDAVLVRDDYTCVYCGATAVPLTIDHVTPRSWGGSHRPSNLVTACALCNSALKGDHDLQTFAHKCRVAFGWSDARVRSMVRRVHAALRRKLPKT